MDWELLFAWDLQDWAFVLSGTIPGTLAMIGFFIVLYFEKRAQKRKRLQDGQTES